MATFQERLEILRQKSATLKGRAEELKRKARETGAKVSAKVAVAAKDAGQRLSLSAKGAGRRMSMHSRKSASRRSIKEQGEFERSSSTGRSLSFHKEDKLDEEAHYEGDRFCRHSDNEEKQDEPPFSPLEPIVEQKPPEIVKPAKHRPTKESWDPKTVRPSRLHESLVSKKWDESIWLINEGVDVNAWKGVLGETSLHEACMKRAPSPVVKALITAGANVNAKSLLGFTPLHAACMYSPSVTVLEVLLHSGCDVNAKTKKNMTPLLLALTEGRAVPILALLLQHGAKTDALSSDEKDILTIAKEKRPDALDLLAHCNLIELLCKVKGPKRYPTPILMNVRYFLY